MQMYCWMKSKGLKHVILWWRRNSENLMMVVRETFTSSNRANMSRSMSETGTSRNWAKSSKSSFCPSSFLALFPYSCRTFSMFLGFSLGQRKGTNIKVTYRWNLEKLQPIMREKREKQSMAERDSVNHVQTPPHFKLHYTELFAALFFFFQLEHMIPLLYPTLLSPLHCQWPLSEPTVRGTGRWSNKMLRASESAHVTPHPSNHKKWMNTSIQINKWIGYHTSTPFRTPPSRYY